MLLHNLSCGRASHVHGDIPAADHYDFLADGELVSKIYVQQKIDAFVNPVEIDSGNAQIAAAMCADGDQYRVKALAPQIGDHEVSSGCMVQFERDVASFEDLSYLSFHHIAGQPVFRDA